MALENLDEVGFLSAELIRKDFISYFKSITTEKGGILWMLRPKSEYLCKNYFNTVKERATLSTAPPLMGPLEKYKIDTPWMKKWNNLFEIKSIG